MASLETGIGIDRGITSQGDSADAIETRVKSGGSVGRSLLAWKNS